jgi:oxygen-independent coproporphyrinogen-3 oxidase
VSGTADYVARVSAGERLAAEERKLSSLERLEEALFTGLRLADGVDMGDAGHRYGFDAEARFGPALAPFVERGLLVRDGSRLRLTREGMLLANEVMAVFV